MRQYALIAVFLVGACANADALDARMKPMVGATEPALIAAMGRTPDTSTESAPGVKQLQWRWQRTYAIPDRMLGYTYAGGAIQPIPTSARSSFQPARPMSWRCSTASAPCPNWRARSCCAAARSPRASCTAF